LYRELALLFWYRELALLFWYRELALMLWCRELALLLWYRELTLLLHIREAQIGVRLWTRMMATNTEAYCVFINNVRVKVPPTYHEVQGGIRSIALLVLNLDARQGLEVPSTSILNSVQKIHFPLKYDKNNGNCA
jgi:hypothetical protein